MPAIIPWILGMLGSGLVTWGLDSLFSNNSSTPAPPTTSTVTTFDWQGLLISICLAMFIGFIGYLIFKNKKRKGK